MWCKSETFLISNKLPSSIIFSDLKASSTVLIPISVKLQVLCFSSNSKSSCFNKGINLSIDLYNVEESSD